MGSIVTKAMKTGATGAFNHVFPPFIKLEDNADGEKIEVEYRSRFSCNWRMIPPVTILVVLIIGVILPIIWESYYLTIPFGLAAITDGYLIYLTQQYPHLKDLTTAVVDLMEVRDDLENVRDALQGQVNHFRATGLALQGQVQTLTQLNQAHQAQLTSLKILLSNVEVIRDDLRDDVGKLKERIQDLIDQNKGFADQIGELQEANATFSEQVDALQQHLQTTQETHAKHLKELGTLGSVLTNVTSSVQKDHASFKKSCDALEVTIQTLDTLSDACVPLKALLQEIAIWKDEGVVQTRLIELAKVKGQLEEVSRSLTEERKRLKKVVNATEAGNAVFQGHLTEMARQLSPQKKKNSKD